MLGHLNNLIYMQFAEEGRVRYFHDVFPKDVTDGFWGENGVILADIQTSFIKQVKWPATIVVGSRMVRFGNSSAEFSNGLFVNGELVARVKSILVWMNYSENKSVTWPQSVRTAVENYEPLKLEK